jgi:putative FmdB family regulatory protein
MPGTGIKQEKKRTWPPAGTRRRGKTMALFEFRCAKCGRRFEELVLSSLQRVACPDCGSDEVEKEFSTFSNGGSCRSSGGFG